MAFLLVESIVWYNAQLIFNISASVIGSMFIYLFIYFLLIYFFIYFFFSLFRFVLFYEFLLHSMYYIQSDIS